MSRATVDAVNSLPEHQPGAAVHRARSRLPVGERLATARDERAAGTSKYPLLKMIKLSVDSVTGFSLFPLRLATYLGLIGGV
jgi:hypothetical protein